MLTKSILTEYNNIIKFLKKLKIDLYLTNTQTKYLIIFIKAFTMISFRGKIDNIAKCFFVNRHKTCVGKFLSKSNWDENKILKIYQICIRKIIWSISLSTGKAIEVIIDDTISEKTRPSSKAKNATEKCCNHWSHTKKKQVYGHQFVVILIKCGTVKLPYSIVLYEKEHMSKIEVATSIIRSMPKPINNGYVLADSWYSCKNLINAAINAGYTYVGALKSNRVIYPNGYRVSINISSFAKNLSIDDFDLVTVKKSKYYVFRYTGRINNFKKVVVILTYPEKSFGKEGSLKSFISTNENLTTREILDIYSIRWDIEVFIRTNKMIFSLNKYQFRNKKALERYLVIQMIAYFYVASRDKNYNFLKSIKDLRNNTTGDLLNYVYVMVTEENKSLAEIKILLKAS